MPFSEICNGEHVSGCRRKPGCVQLTDTTACSETYASLILGGLSSMEKQLCALEEESIQWDIHLHIGQEGKNLMDHSMFVWCPLCKRQSIVSYETYKSMYTANIHKNDSLSTSNHAECKLGEYQCPVAYYASVLSCKNLYIVRQWHWQGVEEELDEMQQLVKSASEDTCSLQLSVSEENTFCQEQYEASHESLDGMEDMLERSLEDAMTNASSTVSSSVSSPVSSSVSCNSDDED
jgi:hypothetical protein